MRVLVTGGSGVLGRATIPLLQQAGHEVTSPGHHDLDLFSKESVALAVRHADAVVHLATRIPPRERFDAPGAWRENDRLRDEAAAILVDAMLAGATRTLVQPTVALVYPSGDRADEDTALAAVPDHLRSALAAEDHARSFASAGRQAVVLRLGLLDGPSTGLDAPVRSVGATLHIDDAARALVAALAAPSGIYNVNRDGERVVNDRFKRTTGWRPLH